MKKLPDCRKIPETGSCKGLGRDIARSPWKITAQVPGRCIAMIALKMTARSPGGAVTV